MTDRVEQSPAVTTVMPTIGRASALTAVDAALAQTIDRHEVVVVFVGPAAEAEAMFGGRDDITLVVTGERVNANIARNLGAREATGTYVALLDDDDVWTDPDKLARQVDAVESGSSDLAHFCGTAYWISGRFDGEVWPARPPRSGEDHSEYLFRRTSTKRRPHGYQTSSWFVTRSYLVDHPFDERESVTHQDWDWLLRAACDPGLETHFLTEPTLTYRFEGADSVSRNTTWRQDMVWATDLERPLTRRARGDFLMTLGLERALRSAEPGAALAVISAAYRVGRPGPAAHLLMAPRLVRALWRRVRRR